MHHLLAQTLLLCLYFLAMSFIYLDWAATAPPDLCVLEAVKKSAMDCYGNPSSIHEAGRSAEKQLIQAREGLAAVLGCGSGEIIFTSGGTEANNMVLFALLKKSRGKKIIISGIEHSSLFEPARILEQLGYKVDYVPAAASGFIDPSHIASRLDNHTAIVALMLVNNETGAIQQVAETAAAIKSFSRTTGRKVLLHTDAVQALGKIPFNLRELNVDSASFSAHKIGGPRGVGALFIRQGSYPDFLYCGGGQERGLRPGTENLPGICGMVLAAEKSKKKLETDYTKTRKMMDFLLRSLADMKPACIIPENRLTMDPVLFSPYILNLSFPPIPGEVLVRVLGDNGIMISTGSACSSKKKHFRIAENMAVPKEKAIAAVRISLGRNTVPAELEALLTVFKKEVPNLLKIARR